MFGRPPNLLTTGRTVTAGQRARPRRTPARLCAGPRTMLASPSHWQPGGASCSAGALLHCSLTRTDGGSVRPAGGSLRPRAAGPTMAGPGPAGQVTSAHIPTASGSAGAIPGGICGGHTHGCLEKRRRRKILAIKSFVVRKKHIGTVINEEKKTPT